MQDTPVVYHQTHLDVYRYRYNHELQLKDAPLMLIRCTENQDKLGYFWSHSGRIMTPQELQS